MNKYKEFDNQLKKLIDDRSNLDKLEKKLNEELNEVYKKLGVEKMFISGLETPEEFDENLANHLLEVASAIARKGSE